MDRIAAIVVGCHDDAVDIVRRNAVNNAWSNLRLLRACAVLSRADYSPERASFFPSMPSTLSHILVA